MAGPSAVVPPTPVLQVNVELDTPLTDVVDLSGSPCVFTASPFATGDNTTAWLLPAPSVTPLEEYATVEYMTGVAQYDSSLGWLGIDGQVHDTGSESTWSLAAGAVEVASCGAIGMWAWCARAGDGSVWCYGDNRYGQIGNGTIGGVVEEPFQTLSADL